LCPLDEKNDMKWQEKILVQIARMIGDGTTPLRKRGNQSPLSRPLTCGVLFTGEYLLGKGSTAARLLTVPFKFPIDDFKFNECLSKPLVVSSFHYFFMQWSINNFDRIKFLLDKWWNQYIKMNFGMHKRLRETHFYLNTVYKLFLLYCVEKGFTSEHIARNEHISFQSHLLKLVRLQDGLARQEATEESENVDYGKLIHSMVKQGKFNLAKNSKEFEIKKHDGLVYNDLLCLRSESLLTQIQRIIPTAILADIKSALIDRKALRLDKEGKNYKVGNTRFYGIHVDKLK